MPEQIDWTVTTFEGNRRQQHEQFRARPFREKLALIEQLGEVATYFASRRLARGGVVDRSPGRAATRPAGETEGLA